MVHICGRTTGVRALIPPTVGGPPLLPPPPQVEESKMTARAVLQCRPNSHPFPERTLVLDQPVKIGRSVARARPATNNAIFDCKVLSRNHALLWYENGKFYLQDTKSSNGTFVNNQRLSKGSEESAPREVCSGDIVQFGVDVMENSRKVTHGCIVATLKLYMPDGQEAKASPSTAVGGAVSSVTAQELYQLRTYLQEAQHREQQIESKLATLQRLVSSTQEAATHSWKAMIDEDRLLQRLETLEAQLTTYAKNYPEDSVREEMRRVLEEKCQSESTAKESIRRILEEKLEAVTKLADLERTVSGSENEVSHMRGVCEGAQRELAHLLDQQAAHNEQVAQLTEKLKLAEEEAREAAEGHEQEIKELEAKLAERVADEAKLQARLESVTAEGDFTKEQLSALKAKYENIKNGEISGGGGGVGSALIRPSTKDITDLDLSSIEPGDMRVALESSQRETHNLRARLQDAQDQLRQAQANVSQLKREAAVADSAEAACLTTRARLQEELCEAKGVSAGSVALTKHLQDQIGDLEERLRECQGLHHPKIYDDIYDDNTSTLVRKKKDLPKDRDKLNEDDAKDSEEDEEEEDRTKDIEEDPDNTLTIIPTKDNNTAIINTTTKECRDSNVNGSLEDKEEKESSLVEENTLRADIKRLQELLDGSRAAQVVAEREVERVRGELAQASSAAITASHEASNLRQQLAASEALVSEKMATVGWLQGQVRRLEEAGTDVRSQLATMTSRLREEQQRAATAHQQAHTLRDKLSEAEQLAQATVEEAEMLKGRIAGLEERLEVCPASSTPLILPPSSSSTLNISSSTSSSSNSSSSSQERVEEDSPSSPHRGLQQNPETVTSGQSISTSAAVSVNTLGSQDEALFISDVQSEGEVTDLREKLRKLQRELSETRRECSEEKERVKELEGGNKTRRRRTDEADGKQQEMDSLVTPISETCPDSTGGSLGSRTSLEAQMAQLKEERDSLRNKLGLITEDYQLLSVQNKTAVALSLVPLCLLLLGFITAFYDTVSAFTATTEYHPPP